MSRFFIEYLSDLILCTSCIVVNINSIDKHAHTLEIEEWKTIMIARYLTTLVELNSNVKQM